jgi:manganese-dependent inorganic pyrophosphatase
VSDSSPVYVIGHKNPDTDAICAAMAYADLLQQTTIPEAIAASCGQLNARTKYALSKAGLEAPRLLVDVRPTAEQLCRKQVLCAHLHEPFFEVHRRMQKHKLRAIPVVDEARKVIGMINLLDLLELLLPNPEDLLENRYIESSLARIRSVLGGTFLHVENPDVDERLVIRIGAMSKEGFVDRLHKYPPEINLIICGDRPSIQRHAIEYGARCIVITGKYAIDSTLLEKAKAKGVTIISSPYDTAMTVMLIKSARVINGALKTDVTCIPENTRLREIRQRTIDEHQPLYPVIDHEDRLVGVLSKSDLISPKQTKLILVDHNEFSQAVTGADEAEILEVIDHHRLGGGMNTRHPIRFINEPVGSTSTMIAGMFREQAIVPDPPIAICMASGIISDTLYLTSPTTTEIDRDLLAWLAPYTHVNIEEFAKELFAAGSALRTHSPDEVLHEDCKTYTEYGWTFSVAQVEEIGMDRFWKRREELETALNKTIETNQLDFGCLLITDITRHFSLLLVAGNDRVIGVIDYPAREESLFELAEVVSRKKQLLPYLMYQLSRLSK